MAISKKTRKILWARSGNLCAICRRKLVIDETELDSESIIGEECHIISGAINGPRSDSNFPNYRIDEVANLLLLCQIDHKLIDDQYEKYTPSNLSKIKTNHENWVNSKLIDQEAIPSIKIKRDRANIPQKFPPVFSGGDLMNLVSGNCGFYQSFPDDLSDDEVELL